MHVSVPLRIEDHEPAGLSAQHTPDAGPATGHRRCAELGTAPSRQGRRPVCMVRVAWAAG